MNTISASVIGAALDMPASLAKTAELLLDANEMSASDVEKAHKLKKGSGRVYIHRLRKFLDKNHGVQIVYAGEGTDRYYIRNNGHEKLVKRIKAWVSKQYHS